MELLSVPEYADAREEDSSAARALRLRDRLRHRQVPLGSLDLRPLWRGQAFERYADAPMTIRRARALEAVLDNVALPIREEECLVGTPAGALADGLPPGVDEQAFAHYREINAAIGERTFVTNSDHAAVDYCGVLEVGLPGRLAEVRRSHDAQTDPARRAFLDSVAITLEAAIRFCRRWAAACRQVAADAAPARQRELSRMAADLEAIAEGAPATFPQAVQLVWLIQVIFNLEGRGAMAFGRMDQYLYPFYARSLEQGQEKQARATLECMWAKLEEPLMVNPIQNIAIGGQTRDGADAVNPLSYLILDVTRTMGTPLSNLSARLCAKTPDAFYDACCEVIKTGIGFPAVFNDEVLVPALVSLGIPVEDAREVAFVGCIETFIPGKMPPWSDSRVNLLRCVDRVLRNGRDGLDGERRGPCTGEPETLTTFDDFMAAYARQVEHMVAEHCEEINAHKRALNGADFTSPFLSAFIHDCVERGLDVNMGGARYRDFHGPAGMALGSTSDALAAVRLFVYDRQQLTWPELLAALDADYQGYDGLRLRLLNAAPKYGNDVPYVDQIAAEVVRIFTTAVLRQRTPSGGRHVPLMAANVSNIPAGREVGATPDGRRALEPVSDAASPTFGRDRRGPTAAMTSLSRVDYRPVIGGTVVNMKFSPETLTGAEGTAILRSLIQTYFRQGGMQLQCNVTGRETLEAARRNPEAYRDLVVRVSGFSALYVYLDDAVQRDILVRTEH
ncbi:MAG: hypothetical protein GX552_04125 [Chloroflexi bacterium]|jgi:pyruvate formate-lyase/glycerol dehydratase family glycyl radical enzyme|nr:hypothetical protein [Chloroflexota bacterium]